MHIIHKKHDFPDIRRVMTYGVLKTTASALLVSIVATGVGLYTAPVASALNIGSLLHDWKNTLIGSPVLASANNIDTQESSTSDTSSVTVVEPAHNIDPSPVVHESPVIEGDSLVPMGNNSSNGATVITPSSSKISVYTVRRGDTLSAIATMFDVDANTIVWANNINKSTPLKEGQTLVILPVSGLRYTPKKGDTFASVAKRFNADAEDIASYNGLNTSDPLVIGTAIIIPNGEATMVIETPKDQKQGVSKRSSVSQKIVVTKSGNTQGRRIITTGAEPAHDVGPEGNASQVAYYHAPIAKYVVTQDIHGYNAVDMGAPEGTPVYAAAAGSIVSVRSGGYNGGYGTYIIISHSNGSQTLYAHLSRVTVSAGQTVGRGEQIGAVGKTGWSTGPHLHFELRGGIMNPF